jgi:hypothetical protein
LLKLLTCWRSWRAPNRATPLIQPGRAVGVLEKLLPHPDQWGFDGYAEGGCPLLQATSQSALVAPNDDE